MYDFPTAKELREKVLKPELLYEVKEKILDADEADEMKASLYITNLSNEAVDHLKNFLEDKGFSTHFDNNTKLFTINWF